VAGIVDRPKQWLINHLWDAQKELRVCAWALDELGEADNTIVVFTTDNGAEVFTWPDGGMTPFKASKGTIFEGGFRVPAIIRWPGHVKPNTVETGILWLGLGTPRSVPPQAIRTSRTSSSRA
jgi:hypothetical protein